MQVRVVDRLVQVDRLLEGSLGVVGEPRVDLDRDVAVDAARPLPHGEEHVARITNVVLGQPEEHLARVVGRLEQSTQLVVVVVALRDRLLEDRRVRRDAGDRALVDQLLQAAAVHELTREVVDPDRLPALSELLKSRFGHASPSPSLPLSPT